MLPQRAAPRLWLSSAWNAALMPMHAAAPPRKAAKTAASARPAEGHRGSTTWRVRRAREAARRTEARLPRRCDHMFTDSLCRCSREEKTLATVAACGR